MDKVRFGNRPAPRAPDHFDESTPMARTQTPRRQPRPLHVEPLENRWLPAGQNAWLATAVTLVPDPVLPALTPALVLPSPAAGTQAMAVGTSDPGTNNPPDGSDAQATSGDGSSDTGSAAGLSQGDPSQTAPDTSAGANGDTSSSADQGSGGSQATTGAPDQGQAQPADQGTGGSQVTIGNPDLGDAQPVQDGVGTASGTLDQAVGTTPLQDLTTSSLTLGTGDQNNQQGSDSGSGNNAGDSGSTGDSSGNTGGDQSGSNNAGDQTGSGGTTQDSGTTNQDSGSTNTGDQATGTTNTGDQTAGTSDNTSDSNANDHHAAPPAGRMGPDPAPSSSGQSGGGDAAGTGKSPPANTGASPPPASSDPAASAPKPQEDLTQRSPLGLAQADVPKTVQKTLTVAETFSSHAESIRTPDAREAGEANAEKRTEGVKGTFSAKEAPPPAAEAEGAVVRAEEGSPRPDVLVIEPAEASAPARAVPPAGSILLAAAMPFDLPALEKGVHGFFAQLDQVGEQIVSAQYRTGIVFWLGALATAGVALGVARRKLRAALGTPAGNEGDPETTWNWLVTPVDELAPEPG